ncbi:murein hydrolase activator EnvC family protein [Robertmurraya sp. GLU-23]
MKKTILSVSVLSLISLGVTLSESPIKALAETTKIEDLKEEKGEIDSKQNSVESEIDETEEKVNSLKSEQAKLDAEIKELDSSITKAEEQMLAKQKEISETETQIAALKEEIKVLEERIAKRNELLKNRARSFQENGSMISYIDVLTGARDFSEFIDRVELVATLMEADRDILREHKADKDQLETSKRDLEKKAESLQVMLKEIETLKQNLNTQKEEKDKLMASLQLEEEELENYKMNLEEEAQLLSSQESAIQKAIELEKKNQAAKQAQNAVSSGGGTSASAPATSAPSVSAPPVSNGSFTRPTSGVLTSGFGSRWGANHFGVDIAQKGTVPVVSAADGVVMNSYYSSSYGNVVFISHSIEGQVYTTVYAHMSSRLVSTGQTVSKGQQIGYQGNTGQSFGQHLHFELHKGSWNAGKTNAINPIGIVPL